MSEKVINLIPYQGGVAIDSKIAALSEATYANSDDFLIINQNGTTKKITKDNFAKDVVSRYALPDNGSITVDFDRTSAYLLTIYHTFAGLNVYFISINRSNTTVSIRELVKEYDKFTVTANSATSITISQTGTGGTSLIGLIRIA